MMQFIAMVLGFALYVGMIIMFWGSGKHLFNSIAHQNIDEFMQYIMLFIAASLGCLINTRIYLQGLFAKK